MIPAKDDEMMYILFVYKSNRCHVLNTCLLSINQWDEYIIEIITNHTTMFDFERSALNYTIHNDCIPQEVIAKRSEKNIPLMVPQLCMHTAYIPK